MTNGCELGGGGALFRKLSKYLSLDYEFLVVIYCLEAFMLFICSKAEITIRTYCETIIKYNQQTKEIRKVLRSKQWFKFTYTILNKRLKINWIRYK